MPPGAATACTLCIVQHVNEHMQIFDNRAARQKRHVFRTPDNIRACFPQKQLRASFRMISPFLKESSFLKISMYQGGHDISLSLQEKGAHSRDSGREQSNLPSVMMITMFFKLRLYTRYHIIDYVTHLKLVLKLKRERHMCKGQN